MNTKLAFKLIEEIIYVPQHFYTYLHIVHQLCQSLSILTMMLLLMSCCGFLVDLKFVIRQLG